jgi:hypothetical protein
MLDKGVWHGLSHLTHVERKTIIRSSMFLKDKYFASEVFEKFKTRRVAGGDQQDKGLYENLSSSTAATSSVLAAAGRSAITIDIGGAFLNADIAPTGVKVHMRLNRMMTQLLIEIDASYKQFVKADGSMVVQLDKALYGCVEAAALWYSDLRGFVANPYDACVLNKLGPDYGSGARRRPFGDQCLCDKPSIIRAVSTERVLPDICTSWSDFGLHWDDFRLYCAG